MQVRSFDSVSLSDPEQKTYISVLPSNSLNVSVCVSQSFISGVVEWVSCQCCFNVLKLCNVQSFVTMFL